MAFHVGLGQDVQAILVTEFIEPGVVGIVAGSYGIDVEALHAEDVLLHLLITDGTSAHGTDVMTVNTVEHHASAVDEEGSVIAHANLAESHLLPSLIYHLSRGIP